MALRVPKEEAAQVTGRLLREQPVLDLTVEDPTIEEVIEEGLRGGMRGLADIYATLFRTDLALQLQYRAEMVIWLINRIVEALVFLSVWSAVARSQGGQGGGLLQRRLRRLLHHHDDDGAPDLSPGSCSNSSTGCGRGPSLPCFSSPSTRSTAT